MSNLALPCTVVCCALLGACTLQPRAQQAVEPAADVNVAPVPAPVGNHLSLPVLPVLPPAAGQEAAGDRIATLPLQAPPHDTYRPLPSSRPSVPSGQPPLPRPGGATASGVPRRQAAAGGAAYRVPPPLPPLSAPDVELARAALDDLMQRINLSDAQIHRRSHVATLLKTGKTAAAAELGIQLDKEVRTAVLHYTVHPDDTLGAIAQRVFGNADLWPLIWRANAGQIRNPAVLPGGTTLAIPLHPTSQEAASAIAEVHRGR